MPGSLTKSEIKGFLEGPFLYLSSRKHNRLGAPRQAERADASGGVTAPSSAEEAQASSATETNGEGNGHARARAEDSGLNPPPPKSGRYEKTRRICPRGPSSWPMRRTSCGGFSAPVT